MKNGWDEYFKKIGPMRGKERRYQKMLDLEIPDLIGWVLGIVLECIVYLYWTCLFKCVTIGTLISMWVVTIIAAISLWGLTKWIDWSIKTKLSNIRRDIYELQTNHKNRK